MTKQIVIGTRGSELAFRQTELVLEELRKIKPECSFLVEKIKTTGDTVNDVPLAKIGDKGLFIKELENALLSNKVDLCVHSMKDLPTSLPEGLKIGAICKREEPRDALVSHYGYTIENLPLEAKVGTSSLRRKAQLLNKRPDLQIVDLRGNLQTRLNKMKSEGLDAVVLAYAGLIRLGLENIASEHLPLDFMLPAVGQGAIGVEIRENDIYLEKTVEKLTCFTSFQAVTAERAFLAHLEGGCQVPIGALAEVKGNNIFLKGLVADLEGSVVFYDELEGMISEPQYLGVELAKRLLNRGAGEILAKIRREMEKDG